MQFLSGFAVFSPALLDLLYYMRLKYECRHHAVPTGFYSTYEELKRDGVDDQEEIIQGFYSTYEELKLRLQHLDYNIQELFLQYL